MGDQRQRKKRDALDPERAVMSQLRRQIRSDPHSELTVRARALLAEWEAERLAAKEAERQKAQAAQTEGSDG